MTVTPEIILRRFREILDLPDARDLPEIAAALIAAAKSGETSRFEELFNAAEDFIVEATGETKQLLIVGFFESIKNVASWENFDYEFFEPWLQPESYTVWRWLEKKWQGRDSLAATASSHEDKKPDAV